MKLVSDNKNPKETNAELGSIYSKKKIIDWMRKGYVCILRDSPDSFFYLVFRDGKTDAINQDLAKQIVSDMRVIREDYRAGWLETKPTGRTRWVIFWE